MFGNLALLCVLASRSRLIKQMIIHLLLKFDLGYLQFDYLFLLDISGNAMRILNSRNFFVVSKYDLPFHFLVSKGMFHSFLRFSQKPGLAVKEKYRLAA